MSTLLVIIVVLLFFAAAGGGGGGHTRLTGDPDVPLHDEEDL